jgi:hypothetical protein
MHGTFASSMKQRDETRVRRASVKDIAANHPAGTFLHYICSRYLHRANVMRLSIALVASIGVLCACSSGTSTTSASPAPSAAPASSASGETARTFAASLVPTNAAGNRLTGRIKLSPSGRAGELTAEVDVRGGAEQKQYGWEVRSGQCGEMGQTVGSPVAYPVIETRADGMIQFRRPVRITLSQGTTYQVVVFADNRSRDTIIACGVLRPE